MLRSSLKSTQKVNYDTARKHSEDLLASTGREAGENPALAPPYAISETPYSENLPATEKWRVRYLTKCVEYHQLQMKMHVMSKTIKKLAESLQKFKELYAIGKGIVFEAEKKFSRILRPHELPNRHGDFPLENDLQREAHNASRKRQAAELITQVCTLYHKKMVISALASLKLPEFRRVNFKQGETKIFRSTRDFTNTSGPPRLVESVMGAEIPFPRKLTRKTQYYPAEERAEIRKRAGATIIKELQCRRTATAFHRMYFLSAHLPGKRELPIIERMKLQNGQFTRNVAWENVPSSDTQIAALPMYQHHRDNLARQSLLFVHKPFYYYSLPSTRKPRYETQFLPAFQPIPPLAPYPEENAAMCKFCNYCSFSSSYIPHMPNKFSKLHAGILSPTTIPTCGAPNRAAADVEQIGNSHRQDVYQIHEELLRTMHKAKQP